ncbi:MAG: hypothetical protein R3C61_29190 [Bacteroidia bacterium]
MEKSRKQLVRKIRWKVEINPSLLNFQSPADNEFSNMNYVSKYIFPLRAILLFGVWFCFSSVFAQPVSLAERESPDQISNKIKALTEEIGQLNDQQLDHKLALARQAYELALMQDDLKVLAEVVFTLKHSPQPGILRYRRQSLQPEPALFQSVVRFIATSQGTCLLKEASTIFNGLIRCCTHRLPECFASMKREKTPQKS